MSELCAEGDDPSVGRAFNSTTKVKGIPLPQLFNRHLYTPHSVRRVSVHTDRYTPAPTLALAAMLPPQPICRSTPRRNYQESENAVKKCRYFKMARGDNPHRINQGFYMDSQRMLLYDRGTMSPSEVLALQSTNPSLSHKPSLFYGTGIRPEEGRTPRKAVQRFGERLKEAVNGLQRVDSDGQLDSGRYSSRLSRTITPGSPILEEGGEGSEEDADSTKHQEVFLTERRK